MNLATELDREKLSLIAADAISKLDPNDATAKRWISAIAKAVAEVETNPFLTYNLDSKSLLILSETSGNIYTSNGTCECKAYEHGHPCYHRALARLVQRYIESE